MENFLIRIWMISSQVFVLFKVTGEEQKEDPLDFVLWKPKKRENHPGRHHGVTDVLAGILSVLLCRKNIWVRKSTFTQAARI